MEHTDCKPNKINWFGFRFVRCHAVIILNISWQKKEKKNTLEKKRGKRAIIEQGMRLPNGGNTYLFHKGHHICRQHFRFFFFFFWYYILSVGVITSEATHKRRNKTKKKYRNKSENDGVRQRQIELSKKMNLFDGEKLMTKATLMRTPSGTRFTMQATALLNTFALNHFSFRNGNILRVVFFPLVIIIEYAEIAVRI